MHDGAQARLIALGISLRATERLIRTDPDAAVALVVESRESSARALAELRALVAGIHPPVLAERGLGDGLRALALDAPVATTTDIHLPRRVPEPVEAAAYFAVAEAVANAAKHAGARSVHIRAAHTAGALRIEVSDDGVGGADPARGTGLRGVERRLATFDGVQARRQVPGPPVLILSTHVDGCMPASCSPTRRAGSDTCVRTGCSPMSSSPTPCAPWRTVARGGAVMDPEVVAKLLARRAGQIPVTWLTNREREVLSLIAEGRSNSAIAQRLLVSEKAVSKHCTSIFAKLDLPPSDDDNRRVLAVLAVLAYLDS